MLLKNQSAQEKLIWKLLKQKVTAERGSLLAIVRQTLKLKKKIKAIAAKTSEPFYLFDVKSLIASIKDFQSSFGKYKFDQQPYYAVKSNHYPEILKIAVRQGMGLDVSSGRELEMALDCKAKKIIFSGPGKSESELKLAIKNRARVIIQIDSFRELEKIAALLGRGEKIRAGIRIYTPLHGSWSKFGIALDDLARFWQAAKKYPQIELQGIQCHMSLNLEVQPYQEIIRILGKYLKIHFSKSDLAQIKFIDLGGGFYPTALDGYYPWAEPQGEIIKLAAEYFDKRLDFFDKYFIFKTPTSSQYAESIFQAINLHLKPIVKSSYFFEPGRIISAKSMHLVMRVADVKSSGNVILNAGNNMVGWEYYTTYYFPVINLTHPALKEIEVAMYGNLCMPEDFWGHYCYAQKMTENDLIIIPNQGAYTYAWAQDFIKPIPKVYKLI
ncbi:MAG: alanine racemase [Candidatus Parcubacteria bacterium]|nr:alanine racemase [Candidatus Parcubacteria bacterium]